MEALRNLVVEKASDALILPTMKDQLRGLGTFIADIRRCKSKEAELKRVNKELGNIRTRLKTEKSLDGYQRKKYIAKLLFIYLLGHRVDFGYLEAINLAASDKFSEKSIGYMFLTVTFALELDEEILPLLIQTLKNDLRSSSNIHSVIALQTSANMCCMPIVDALYKEVAELFRSTCRTDSPLIPSVIPCFTAFLRCKPEIIPITNEDVVCISNSLKSKRYTTVSTSINLLEQLMRIKPDVYQPTLATAIGLLEEIVSKNEIDHGSGLAKDQYYYMFYTPWSLVKLLRVLRLYSYDEVHSFNDVKSILSRIINLAILPHKSKRSHYVNTKYSIGYEAVSLIIHLDCDIKLMHTGCNLLMTPLNSTDSNLKGLGLALLTKMAQTETGLLIVEKLAENIINLLKTETDSSVRKLGFDVAYCICNKDNVETIVAEILNSLPKSPNLVRQELALRMAILAEKFANTHMWYVDQMLKLMHTSGEHVSENVWFRLIQVITNNEDVQGHAAKAAFNYLQFPDINENLIKICAYIIGEFGNLIANDQRSSPPIQLQLLQSWLPYVSFPTKHIIITSYGKMLNLYPEIGPQIEEFLSSPSIIGSLDVELQQRASELLSLSKMGKPDLLIAVFDIMPQYNTDTKYLSSRIATKIAEQTEDSKNTGLLILNEQVDKAGSSRGNMPQPASANEIAYPTMLSNGVVECLRNFVFSKEGCLFTSEVIRIQAMVICGTNMNPTSTVSLIVMNVSGATISNIEATSAADYISNKCVTLSFTSCPNINSLESGEMVASVTLTEPFFEPLHFYMNFSSNEKRRFSYRLCLPLFLEHFMCPMTMQAQDFLMRWQGLAGASVDDGILINTKKPMERRFIEGVIKTFNLEILLGVDPIAINYCAAGGLYATSLSVGILLRLELSLEAHIYRLTIRSSNEMVTKYIAEKMKILLQ